MGEMLEAVLARFASSSDNPAWQSIEGIFAETAAGSPEDYWGFVSEHFGFDDDLHYMNTATIGTSPVFTHEAVATLRETFVANPSSVFVARDLAYESFADLQQFIGSKTPLGFASNFSSGLEVVFGLLRLGPGDTAIVSTEEYSPVLDAFENQRARFGVDVRQVRTPLMLETGGGFLSAYEEAMDEVAKSASAGSRCLVFVSHVQNSPGFVLPVQEIAAAASRHDFVTVVDGSQALGQISVDVDALGADFYLATLAKWMMAPIGTGVIHASERGRKLLKLAGHQRVQVEGFLDYVSLTGVGIALKFIERIGGIARIQSRLYELAHCLRSALAATGRFELVTPIEEASALQRDTSGGITFFRWQGEPPTEPAGLTGTMLERGLSVGLMPYPTSSMTAVSQPVGTLYGRVSPHIFIEEYQIDYLVKSLLECVVE